MLRREHNKQVAAILNDPEATDNDKYVALTMLRNAEVACKGQLPFCQDTGTAIIHAEKGQQVWTGFEDEEPLAKGASRGGYFPPRFRRPDKGCGKDSGRP